MQPGVVPERLDAVAERALVAAGRGRVPGVVVEDGEETGRGLPDLGALVGELLGRPPGGYEGTLGDGVEALWYDTWLHGDDIRAATGRPSVQGDGMRSAVSHVRFELAKRGWVGDVPEEGDAAFGFILAATGRAPSGPDGPLDIYA